jgi:hypothetical protein
MAKTTSFGKYVEVPTWSSVTIRRSKQTQKNIIYLVIIYRNLFRIGYNLKVSEIESSNWLENRFLRLLLAGRALAK